MLIYPAAGCSTGRIFTYSTRRHKKLHYHKTLQTVTFKRHVLIRRISRSYTDHMCGERTTFGDSPHYNIATASIIRRNCTSPKGTQVINFTVATAQSRVLRLNSNNLYHRSNKVTCQKQANHITALSEACTISCRSDTGIVGSNPSRRNDVRLRFLCICVVLCR